MNRLVKRSATASIRRIQSVQQRQFLFVIVPIIGAGLAVLVGGAVTIYGMEKYRIYQMNKEKESSNNEIVVEKKDETEDGKSSSK